MSKTLTTFTLLSLLLILLGINRGFDISDEGLYALLAVPDQENIAGIFNYDLFFKLFYKISGIEFGLVGLRLLRLFLYFLGGAALTFFWGNLSGTKKFSSNHFLIATLGLFAGYGFLPQTLSYNSLTVVLASFWLAVISTQKKNMLQYFLLGVLLSCFAYVKITACLGLSLLTLLWMLDSNEIKFNYLLGLIIPFILIELLLYLCIGDFGFSRMIEAKELMGNRSSYSLLFLAKYELVGGFWIFSATIPFLIAGSLIHYSPKLKIAVLLIGVLALNCIAYYTAITEEWNHVILLVTAALVAYYIPKFQFTTTSPYQRFLFLTLLILPFVLHFGSNVYWLRLGIHFWVFWILAILFIFDSIQLKYRKPIHVAVGGLSFLLVLNGIWIHPFEQEPLWNANSVWKYKGAKEIKVTSAQLVILDKLKVHAEDTKSLMTCYRIPGYAYLLGKSIPRSPGFWDLRQLEFHFPKGLTDKLILYHPYDSLPNGTANGYLKENLILPNGEHLQVLWRE